MALALIDIDPSDSRLVTDVFDVLVELREHLTPDALQRTYDEGFGQGLRFLAAYESERCVGVAGWRIVVNTSTGRKLYIDDLVTAATSRSAGVGRALMNELERRAVAAGCSVLDLDSGVQRDDAHRFYFRERLSISAFHFAKRLS